MTRAVHTEEKMHTNASGFYHSVGGDLRGCAAQLNRVKAEVMGTETEAKIPVYQDEV